MALTHEAAIQALTSGPTATADQVAVALGLSRGSVYDAAERGDLQTLRVGRRVLFATAPLRAARGLDTTDAN